MEYLIDTLKPKTIGQLYTKLGDNVTFHYKRFQKDFISLRWINRSPAESSEQKIADAINNMRFYYTHVVNGVINMI